MTYKNIFLAILSLSLIISCADTTPKPAPSQGLSIEPATADQVLAAINQAQGEVVLVNLWATWCQPCVEEFPDIMSLYQKYKDRGLKIVFVSADFENQTEAAKAFLKKQGVDFATYQKSGKDMAFINTLDERWSGALPATWIYDGKGNKHHFWEGKRDHAHFEKAILDVLEK